MIQIPLTRFPGSPHHIVPRGRTHEPVFTDSTDCLTFLGLMHTASTECGLEIWTYALMRNHVHMIAVPQDRDSISNAMTETLNAYAELFSDRHNDSHGGHGINDELWHRRCHSVAVQTRYLWKAIRYVERNPVRAGIVSRAEDYRWSSAAFNCGLRDSDPLVSPASPLRGSLRDWSSWLAEPDRDSRLAYLRRKDRDARERGGMEEPEVIGLLERELDRRISRGGRGN